MEGSMTESNQVVTNEPVLLSSEIIAPLIGISKSCDPIFMSTPEN